MSSSQLEKHENLKHSLPITVGEERCHLIHENTRTKSKSSVWICRADTVVIIAITVSALIALIALNWLLLSWSVITCDLSVTRLQEFSGVSLSGTMLSQLVTWKVSPKVFIGSREAPSDHKWLRYCFTDRKAKMFALNMQPDEILKSIGVPSELKKIDLYFDFFFSSSTRNVALLCRKTWFFFSFFWGGEGEGAHMCKYNSCTKHDWLQGMVQIPQPMSPLFFCWDMLWERETAQRISRVHPGVTSETEYLTLFRSVSHWTCPLSSSEYS